MENLEAFDVENEDQEGHLREKLRLLISREMEKAIGRDGSTLSEARSTLKRRYLGYGYENDDNREKRGLSCYVDRTVMEVVEWAKPGLLRVFSGDEIVRFDPKRPDDEQAASDATTYINQVCFNRNMFRIVHDTLSDGLYQRVGWCIAHAPKVTERTVEKFTGLLQQEAAAILTDPTINMDGGETEVVQYEGVDPQSGQPAMLFDVTIHRDVERREIKIEPVPTEQVIISGDAQDVEHARFVAHWQRKTASQLRKEGYSADTIDDLPQFGSDDEMPETTVGRRVNAETDSDDNGLTGATREYKVYEAWLDYDMNGDGIAEKVKVTFVGDGANCKVLDWEEWPLYRAPLFSACSVPMPHQVVGLCVADLVSDLQDLRSDLTRNMLDNLALTNSSELIVNEGTPGVGDVEYDSLLAREVGGIHRIRGDASITPLPVTSAAADTMSGLEMASDLIERRTGISSRTQSIKADSLQNTATGASIQEEALNQRLELVARVYAETFFKPLGRYLLHLVHKYQDKEMQLRVKGRFMAFDPRKWDPDMEISVTVGLGTGDRSKMLGTYQQILQIQQAFMQQLGPSSPVRLSNVIYTCHKLAEAAGLEAPERFFGTEEDARRSEQMMAQNSGQPSPEQQKLQLEQQKAQAKIQMDQQKAQTEAQRKAFETQSKLALEKQKIEGQVALKAQEMRTEAQLDGMRLAMGERGAGLTNIRGVV